MEKTVRATSFAFPVFLLVCLTSAACCYGEDAPPTSIAVAAVQFHPRETVEGNTGAIVDWIAKCAKAGTRVVVFQECATTGYVRERINAATSERLLEAERKIAAACAAEGVYAVVGTPHDEGSVRYNTAVVFSPTGETVTRYAKMQLVGGDDWAVPGETLSVFKVDGIPCSIIICHDERYPELVRLPVLAGARLVFYISSESNVKVERKLEPYRAQICARADENDVFIVHANSPAMESHGQSRIVRPDGNVVVEATMFGEESVSATIEMEKANGSTARNSFRSDPLREWWLEGVKKVVIED
jgi:predicted amidohydrolase